MTLKTIDALFIQKCWLIWKLVAEISDVLNSISRIPNCLSENGFELIEGNLSDCDR